MPPKSAKKEKPLWFKCDKCGCSVVNIELAKHQNCTEVDQLSCFVNDKKFISKSLNVNQSLEDYKNFYESTLNNIAWLSTSVLKLCEFILGQYVKVQLESSDGQSEEFVKSVWPIPDDSKLLHKVQFYCIDDFPVKTTKITISALSKALNECLEIGLICEDQNDHTIKQNKNEMMKLLKKQKINHVILGQSRIILNLCNKKISFRVKYIRTHQNEMDQLTNIMENLKKSSYFQISRQTEFICIEEKDEEKLCSENLLNLDYVGGLDTIVSELRGIADSALGLLENKASVKVNRVVLVYGVSGVGKTLLANAIANHYKCSVIRFNCTEIFSKYFGESEENVMKHFNKVYKNFPKPSIMIIEDVHNICARNDSSDIGKRISGYFTNILDNLQYNQKASKLLVIATTTNPELLNPSVRRSGRIEYEIEIPVPNAIARKDILSKILKKYKNSMIDEEIADIANITHGYVGADLDSLVSKSMSLDSNNGPVTHVTLLKSTELVKPSAMREIMIESPNVKWGDIGGMHDLKLKLKQIIEWPIYNPELFKRLGISPPRGLLMYGPPGCSKTMIAKAIASESKVNFLSIKGSELFSMWVGESERAVRDLFRKARQVAPSVIFFDEIDAICGERSAESGSSVKERVLAQILTEIDGVNILKDVKIIAATNRPDMIDKALTRPGRLDRLVYVGLPDTVTRREIFKIKLKNIPIANDVDVESLVGRTEGYSGSEIEAICQEAVLKALEYSFDVCEISNEFFNLALEQIKPRTSSELLELYKSYIKTI